MSPQPPPGWVSRSMASDRRERVLACRELRAAAGEAQLARVASGGGWAVGPLHLFDQIGRSIDQGLPA